MKRKIIIVFVLTLLAYGALAQVNRRFFDKNGRPLKDSVKAVSYTLTEKLNDTAYDIVKYNMQGFVLIKGTYKDPLMKIPNGKFWFYVKNRPDLVVRGPGSDTANFVLMTGYYENGSKDGSWVDYSWWGRKYHSYCYVNGEMNGPYQEFDINTGELFQSGNLTNGKKEGEWNTYMKGHLKPLFTDIYKHNKVIGTDFHTKGPKAAINLDKYVQKSLDIYMDYLKSESIIVELSVTEEGKVDSILSVNKPLNEDVLTMIKNTFSKAPNFTPGLSDDQPIRQSYFYNFNAGSFLGAGSQRDAGESLQSDIMSRHANDIGRGLNRVGIGTPVTN